MKNHIFFDPQSFELRLLDQRFLPGCQETFICSNVENVIEALQKMVVRGAPAIGVTAAFGCVLAAHSLQNIPHWQKKLDENLEALANARPTAVNLRWAVQRMRQCIAENMTIAEIEGQWLKAAQQMQTEDENICRQIGQSGESLIKNGDTILTHCNAGALATAGYGTALGVIRAAFENGKKIQVIADETRPFLQGARLTAYELHADGIPVTVACDNACALLMQKNMVQLVIVGADRVAANGDTANKIGTFGVAIMAKYFHVPFYVACPLSTIDISIADGTSIPIEQRPADEVSKCGSMQICPKDVPVYNFAFDVTPASLIDGIITEKGILRPPFQQSIGKIFEYAYKRQ